jgi:hypothetical protein
MPKLARGFLIVCAKAGSERRTGLHYWRTLLQVLARNPAAIDVVVNLAAMYLHFSKQSRYVVGALDRAARRIHEVGEDRYNMMMLAGQFPKAV